MALTKYYERTVDEIARLKREYDNARNAYDGALADLSQSIQTRLAGRYEGKIVNYEGVRYKIIAVRCEGSSHEIRACLYLERADDYKPTSVEERKLATRPKSNCMWYWLQNIEPIYAWEGLKNKIFRKVYHEWNLNEDDIANRIENLRIKGIE